MKKYWILITVFMGILFVLSACTGTMRLKTSETETTALTEMEVSEEKTTETEKSWSKQDIDAMFYSIREDDWVYIDSVLISDHTYDRVGAVLFWDDAQATSNVAFFDAEGYCQQAGVYEKTTDEANFTYLGDGTVSFDLETDDGQADTYTLTFSMDGDNVHFTVN